MSKKNVRVVKFTMKGIVARTSGRLIQGGMIGHAPCKKFELCRNVYGEILRGLPTDINITLTYRHGANPSNHTTMLIIMAAFHVRMHSNITNIYTIYTLVIYTATQCMYMAHTYLIHIPLS